MAKERDRLPWEYADGPVVGRDIPITNEPRDELAPGVPNPPEPQSDRHQSSTATEVREVRAEDPELSPETNQRVTEELREVIGSERVRVPADRPRVSQGEERPRQTFGTYLNMHRFQLIRATAIILTFGAIVALVTGDWWVLPLAAGIHALGTMTVVMTVLRMTTISEHPAPEVAAAMAEDGVSSPDERFSEMVEEFSEPEHSGTAEVLSPGSNQRTTEASSEPARAAAEQSSAMTPAAQPTQPVQSGEAADIATWTLGGGLVVLSVVLPAVMGGGWLWLLTAVMVPLAAAWVVFQRVIRRHPDKARVDSGRALIAIVLCTAGAVAAFCAVVAVAFQH